MEDWGDTVLVRYARALSIIASLTVIRPGFAEGSFNNYVRGEGGVGCVDYSLVKV